MGTFAGYCSASLKGIEFGLVKTLETEGRTKAVHGAKRTHKKRQRGWDSGCLSSVPVFSPPGWLFMGLLYFRQPDEHKTSHR